MRNVGVISKAPNYKTIMKIGNMTIYQEKHFNWFNKLMFKLVFNIEIADYKGDE
jgi:hypothetical protein